MPLRSDRQKAAPVATIQDLGGGAVKVGLKPSGRQFVGGAPRWSSSRRRGQSSDSVFSHSG
jgi:hypothetical protein